MSGSVKADFSPIDHMPLEQVVNGCVHGAIMPTIERLYLTKGPAVALEFIKGVALGIAGAAFALGDEGALACGGDKLLKELVDVINAAADADALDESPRS